jgi:ring-1,2-phenylacetyl-CoA epoxidase subunit PaaE
LSAPRFHPLTIAGIREETADARCVTFSVPAALKSSYDFVPGQYVTLRADIDGEDVRRSYSVCSTPDDDGFSIGIRCIPSGAFSGFVRSLDVGNVLDVMTPQGRFVAPVGGTHDYLLLAAGSGITPIMSITASVLKGEPESRITLIYANRTTSSIMFRSSLGDLKDRYVNRFSILHVLEEENQEVDLLNGRLDREKLRAFAAGGVIQPEQLDGVYICGPTPMMTEASEAMAALGVSADKIHYELFTPPGGPPPTTSGATSPKPTPESGVVVDVVLDGVRRQFRFEEKDETVLVAAKRAGLDLPYSCAGGMCCTCRCKALAGTYEMVQNYSLQPWEIEAGFTLACQTRPTSDMLILDFDAT